MVWLPTDRAKAVALTLYEQSLCSGCGQPAHLGHDPQLGWDIPPPSRCLSCAALRDAGAKYKDQDPELLRFSLRPVFRDEMEADGYVFND